MGFLADVLYRDSQNAGRLFLRDSTDDALYYFQGTAITLAAVISSFQFVNEGSGILALTFTASKDATALSITIAVAGGSASTFNLGDVDAGFPNFRLEYDTGGTPGTYTATLTSYTDTDAMSADVTGLSEAVVLADAMAPAAPTIGTVVAGDGQLTVPITMPDDADAQGYELHRSIASFTATRGNTATLVHSVASGVAPSAVINYADDGSGTGTGASGGAPNNGVDYFYRAFARDEVPNWCPHRTRGAVRLPRLRPTPSATRA